MFSKFTCKKISVVFNVDIVVVTANVEPLPLTL